jgi:hypothetical protein
VSLEPPLRDIMGPCLTGQPVTQQSRFCTFTLG